MEEKKIKSGKEIVDDFFNTISTIDGIDAAIANCLANLYTQGNLTDTKVINELAEIRKQNGN